MKNKMKNKKRVVLILLAIFMALMLNGCAESSSDKLARLEKEADEARQKAKEAQDDYENLERLVNTINTYGGK